MTRFVTTVLISLISLGCAEPNSAGSPQGEIEILNASYDPTRELWRELVKERHWDNVIERFFGKDGEFEKVSLAGAGKGN